MMTRIQQRIPKDKGFIQVNAESISLIPASHSDIHDLLPNLFIDHLTGPSARQAQNMRIRFYDPTPAPPGLFKDVPLPLKKANPLSQLFFHWITPIVKVGYSRHIHQDGEFIVAFSGSSLIDCSRPLDPDG